MHLVARVPRDGELRSQLRSRPLVSEMLRGCGA